MRPSRGTKGNWKKNLGCGKAMQRAFKEPLAGVARSKPNNNMQQSKKNYPFYGQFLNEKLKSGNFKDIPL